MVSESLKELIRLRFRHIYRVEEEPEDCQTKVQTLQCNVRSKYVSIDLGRLRSESCPSTAET